MHQRLVSKRLYHWTWRVCVYNKPLLSCRYSVLWPPMHLFSISVQSVISSRGTPGKRLSWRSFFPVLHPILTTWSASSLSNQSLRQHRCRVNPPPSPDYTLRQLRKLHLSTSNCFFKVKECPNPPKIFRTWAMRSVPDYRMCQAEEWRIKQCLLYSDKGGMNKMRKNEQQEL